MQWMFLIGNNDFGIETLKRVAYPEEAKIYDVESVSGRCCVELGEEHLFYDLIEDMNDFEEDILRVPFDNPTIIMLTYSSFDIVKEVILHSDFPRDIYIDNDMGVIVPIDEFISRGFPM